MGWVRRAGGAVGVGAVLWTCSPPPPPTPPAEPTAVRHEALSDPGQELFVPLRFIQLVPSSGHADIMAYGQVLRAIDAANEVFKAAGLQFSTTRPSTAGSPR